MAINTLIIVGCGIKFMSHLTIEAKSCIEKSDKVLYLVNEPIIQEWIKKNSVSSESLDECYAKFPLRNDNYISIAEFILEKLKNTKKLCVVIYGHPTVFVQPSIYAANMAVKNGHKVIIMPGISTEDCLYADLFIDPGSSGCQSFEATDFLIHRRSYDSSSHLVIWQPYVIGVLGLPVNHDPCPGLKLLMGYLQETYALEHELVLYEAAQYPIFNPKIDRILLKDLPDANISRLTTIYIPPNKLKKPDENILRQLRLDKQQ